MDKPKSVGKKGILASIWEQITTTDCGCAPGSSCCGPTVTPSEEERREARAVEPAKEEKSGGK